MVDVSIILPAWNEGDLIRDSLLRLAGFLEAPGAGPWSAWEILVVDDGSTDDTAAAARSALPGDGRVRVIETGTHRGKGAAVRDGVIASTGSRLVVTDVDLSYGLGDIARAVAALGTGAEGPSMVTGDRRHPDSRMDLALSALGHVVRRQCVSVAFNLAVRLFYRIPWRDTQCGLKAFRRDDALRIVDRVRTAGFLADIEMFLAARGLGLAVASLPVHLTCLSDDSTVHVVRQMSRVIRDAIEIKKAQVRGDYGAPHGGGSP